MTVKGRKRPIAFVQAFDGEWLQPIRRGYHIKCCDCGLVHRLRFRIVDGRVQFAAWRDERATAAARKAR